MNRLLNFASWLLIAIVTSEVCARVEDNVRYGAPLLANYSFDSIYAYDSLGKHGKPNSGYLQWHLNEAGYRGPALRRDTYRIMAIGSSETFGLYESESMEWPRQLEQMLNADDPSGRVEVVNTALPGMTIRAALDRLPQTLARLHPDAVAIYPSYANYIGKVRSARTRLNVPKEMPELRILGRLDNLSKRTLPDSVQDALRAVQVRLSAKHLRVNDRIPQASVDLFESDLDQLVTELQRRNIEVVLATHATRFGEAARPEDKPFLISWRKSYPELREDGFLDMEQRMTAAVQRIAQRHNIDVVDAAHRVAPGAENFAEFVHFTDHGATALASLFAEEMRGEVKAKGIRTMEASLQLPH